MEEKENEKAIKLLAIRNASGIKGRIEEQKALKDTAKENILSEEAKDSSSGKTNKEKIEEYKDKYKYNAFDVMFIIPALVKYFLNKDKSDKLKELNKDIEKKVEEQINNTAKAFYGNDKNMDEARRQEMAANMKNNVNELVNKIISKNTQLSENLEKDGAILDKSGLERLLSSQICEVVNNDESLKACFDTSALNAQVSGQTKPNADLIKENRKAEDLTLNRDPGLLLAAVQDNMNRKQDVIVDKEQLKVLQITDASPIVHFPNNPSVNFGIKQNIGNNRFLVGQF
ncbi:MAG: hypothetical protein IJ590_03650 [Rickettsiales bacterium]|nr:hypothetical protein [Rickettsiales bacterium]